MKHSINLFLRQYSHLSGILSTTILIITVLTACNANPALNQASQPIFEPVQRGGTLTILDTDPTMNLEPAKSQSLAITSSSLFLRRLTTWQTLPHQPTIVVPDLAENTGITHDGGRTWTYTLKKGIYFEDGTPIRAQDIKYAVERSFTPLLAGGYSYHKLLLIGGNTYQGPYTGKSLTSIETPTEREIIFHLNRPFADWPWIVSQPAFAPVPAKADDPRTYYRHPIASGPYKVAENIPGVRITFTRNPFWSVQTDPNRTAGPDSIIFRIGQSASTVNQSLIDDAGSAQTSFAEDFVPANTLAQIQSLPTVKNRLAEAGGGSLDMLELNTSREVLRNRLVRQAIAYAVDKNSYRVSLGGASRGTIATTNIPPAIPGYKPFNVFPAPSTGDIITARELLRKAGYPQGISLDFICENSETAIAGAQSIQASLARANITLRIRPLDPPSYDDLTRYENGSGYDIVLGTWQADYPSPASMLEPSFSSAEISVGGFNISRYSNPTVDKLINAALGETHLPHAYALWEKIDRIVTSDAATIPLLNRVNTFIYGGKIRNFYVPPFPAYPNYFKVSLAHE